MNNERVLSIEKATEMIYQKDYSRCRKCIHRFEEIDNLITCRVTALTMVNEERKCIWFEEGDISDKGLNIELAKKRMDGDPIYWSTMNMVE